MHARLTNDGVLPHVPSRAVLRVIMRDELGMRFRSGLGAKLMYNSPAFDEKRVWVSRLLAQLHLEGAVIVSVDESAFKSEMANHKFWHAPVHTKPKKPAKALTGPT